MLISGAKDKVLPGTILSLAMKRLNLKKKREHKEAEESGEREKGGGEKVF